MKIWPGMNNADLVALKQLKNVMPPSLLCCVYYNLIGSHLQYGDIIWVSLSKTVCSSPTPSRSSLFDN